MPTIRGSFRRLEAPSDVFYLEIHYQMGSPVTWDVTVTGGSRSIEPMQGLLAGQRESEVFVRDAVIAAVRERIQAAIVQQG
ncbi:hypothetical protein Herbaro_05405 [Herbaspirillum sp. WKF16]|jgi:hypothetical protein|uniref:hypothetical protein n=1 Tax=Herbaspirillum sp. WKF16 TaxID=3028312 RepID=UPI0023A91E94|nr:hypothetical protein [Herbaspirillum sp. WKF16]WDZ97229.1 hypothetical protein Herbaro_05405 [Herbaspirillum sp. WKF16]